MSSLLILCALYEDASRSPSQATYGGQCPLAAISLTLLRRVSDRVGSVTALQREVSWSASLPSQKQAFAPGVDHFR
jgi:hypothetical protein